MTELQFFMRVKEEVIRGMGESFLTDQAESMFREELRKFTDSFYPDPDIVGKIADEWLNRGTSIGRQNLAIFCLTVKAEIIDMLGGTENAIQYFTANPYAERDLSDFSEKCYSNKWKTSITANAWYQLVFGRMPIGRTCAVETIKNNNKWKRLPVLA